LTFFAKNAEPFLKTEMRKSLSVWAKMLVSFNMAVRKIMKKNFLSMAVLNRMKRTKI
jgi:hypothetical protein